MTKQKMLLPMVCDTHAHAGYGTRSDVPCPWCENARLQHDIEAGSAEIAKLHRLMCRVLEWEPALPAESGLLDELASAVKGRAVEPTAECTHPPGRVYEHEIDGLKCADCMQLVEQHGFCDPTFVTRAAEPSAEPHVIKQIEHALDDCCDKIDKGVADYIRGCISDYRHALNRTPEPR